MKEVNTLKFATQIADLTFYQETGYIETTYLPKKLESIDEAKDHIRTIAIELDEHLPIPMLVDIRYLKGVSKEVRDYIGKEDVATRQTKCLAILVGSGIPKIMGNIFMRFSKPPYPTRLFTNKEKAIEWLMSMR